MAGLTTSEPALPERWSITISMFDRHADRAPTLADARDAMADDAHQHDGLSGWKNKLHSAIANLGPQKYWRSSTPGWPNPRQPRRKAPEITKTH